MIYASDISIILLKIGCKYIPIYCNKSYPYFVYDKEMDTFPYLMRYCWCKQSLKYALEMACIRKWLHCQDMTLSDIWSQYLTHQDLPQNSSVFYTKYCDQIFLDMTKGNSRNTWMTKLKYCLYPWRKYIVFRMYIRSRFDQIWCISTKLRICIRNVCIL